MTQLDRIDVTLGFQITALPKRAGAVERFPAIAEKLNGVIAATKPSKPRIRKLLLTVLSGLIG